MEEILALSAMSNNLNSFFSRLNIKRRKDQFYLCGLIFYTFFTLWNLFHSSASGFLKSLGCLLIVAAAVCDGVITTIHPINSLNPKVQRNVSLLLLLLLPAFFGVSQPQVLHLSFCQFSYILNVKPAFWIWIGVDLVYRTLT